MSTPSRVVYLGVPSFLLFLLLYPAFYALNSLSPGVITDIPLPVLSDYKDIKYHERAPSNFNIFLIPRIVFHLSTCHSLNHVWPTVLGISFTQIISSITPVYK